MIDYLRIRLCGRWYHRRHQYRILQNSAEMCLGRPQTCDKDAARPGFGPHTVSDLVYADDTNLFLPHVALLPIFITAAATHGLKASQKKTRLRYLGTGCKLTLAQEVVESAESFMYLGSIRGTV